MAGRLAALVAVAVLGGCGGASGASETESSTGTQPAGTAAATAPEVLRFTTPIVGGGELDGSSLAGRPVAFWFWAPT